MDEAGAVRTYEREAELRAKYPAIVFPVKGATADGVPADATPIDGQPAASTHENTTDAAIEKATATENGRDGDGTNGSPRKPRREGGGAVTVVPIQITPTDLARVVRGNEVRERLGLGELPGGDRTIAEIAQAMNPAPKEPPTSE